MMFRCQFLAAFLILVPTVSYAQDSLKREVSKAVILEQLACDDPDAVGEALRWLQNHSKLDSEILQPLSRLAQQRSNIGVSYATVLRRLTDKQLIAHAKKSIACEGSYLSTEIANRAYRQDSTQLEHLSNSSITEEQAYHLILELSRPPGKVSLIKLDNLRVLRFRSKIEVAPQEIDILFQALPHEEIVRVKLGYSLQSESVRNLRMIIRDPKTPSAILDDVQTRILKGLSNQDPEVRIGCLKVYFWTKHSKKTLTWLLGQFENEAHADVQTVLVESLINSQVDPELACAFLMEFVNDKHPAADSAMVSLGIVGQNAAEESKLKIVQLASKFMEKNLVNTEIEDPESDANGALDRVTFAQAAVARVAVKLDERNFDKHLSLWIGELDDLEKRQCYLSLIAKCGPKAGKAIPSLEAILETSDDFDSKLAVARQLVDVGSNSATVMEVSKIAIADVETYRQVQGLQIASRLGVAAGPIVPEIIAYLKSPNAKKRSMAFSALAHMGTSAEPAVATIGSYLGGEKQGESSALRTIGKLGPIAKETVPQLTSILTRERNKDDGQKARAMRALAAIGQDAKQAIGPLKLLAQSSNLSIADAAKAALKKIE